MKALMIVSALVLLAGAASADDMMTKGKDAHAMQGQSMRGPAMKHQAMQGQAMHGPAMKHQAMTGQAMHGPAMKHTAMKDQAMKGGAMMHGDAMKSSDGNKDAAPSH